MYIGLLPGLKWLASAIWMPVGDSVWVPGWLQGVQIPKLSTDSAAQLHAMSAVNVVVGLTTLWLIYLAAIRLAHGRPTRAGAIIVFEVGILAQTLAVLAPYGLSGDVYSYALYGRIFSVYGGSPYLQPPIAYASDPFYSYVFWVHVPSFYGPLWTEVSSVIVGVAGTDVGLTVFLFRLLESASALVAGWLVYWLLRRADPDRALAGTILLTWCPLLILESGLDAHNDVLMGLLLVAGLVLAGQGRVWTSILSVGAVVLAGLVKLTALALLPLLGIYLLRTAPSWPARAIVLVGSGLVAAGVGAAIILPVWVGPETFAVQTLGSGPDRYVNSPAEPALGEIRKLFGATTDDLEVPLQFGGWWVGVHTETVLYSSRAGDATIGDLPVWSNLLVVGPEREHRLRVYDPLRRQVGYADTGFLGPIDQPPEYANDPDIAARIQGPVGSPDLLEANRLIRMVGWGAFGLAMPVALIFGTRSIMRVATAWIGLCLVLQYVTLTWFWPWYVLWGLMPAALVPRSRLTRLTVYLAWGVMLAYGLLGFQDTRFWYLHNYRAVAMFGLPLLLFVLDELLRGIVRIFNPPPPRLVPMSPAVAERLRSL